MEDLHARHEDVAADASRAAAAYLSVAVAAAQRHVERRAAAALRASLPPLPTLPSLPALPAQAPTAGGATRPGAGLHASAPSGATATASRITRAAAAVTSEVSDARAEAQDLAARYADVARQALPQLAPALLADPGWPGLAAELDRQAAHGTDPVRLLQDTAAQRELDSARHPALVLTRRLRPATPASRPPGNAAAVSARSHPPLPTTSASLTARPASVPAVPPAGTAAARVLPGTVTRSAGRGQRR